MKNDRRGVQLLVAVAAVVATSFGAGAYWLRTHEVPAAAQEEQTAAVPNEQDRIPVTTSPAQAVSTSAVAQPVAARVRTSPATNAAMVTIDVTPPPSPAPAIEPFFETTDVNEPPRVQRRVEPHVPDDLRAQAVSEVVIVRVLVSQGGHPTRVSLLRRSKTGPPLDNAVIAAVNHWTFAPARKRGEAVSCWLNIGVPVAN